MASTLQTLWETEHPISHYILAGSVVAITSGIVLHKVLRKKKPRLVEAPPDTAVIYQFKRGPYAPSLSPFPMKLEMFCRLAKIPYKVDCHMIPSSKGKNPWMQYNEDTVEDSQFCIEYFNKHGFDINKHLDKEQRATSKFIQVLADEHLYWTLVYFRWIADDDYFPGLISKFFGVPRFLIRFMRHKLRGQLNGQGMGRHTQEEIQQILMSDLKALSDFLGSKPYMLGDQVCEGDCAAFGMLAQILWHQKDKVLGNILQDHFPNLHQYCLRIKENYWPDWDECCKAPKN